MNLKTIGVAILAAVIALPASAADDDAKKKKGKGKRGQQNVANQLLKQLEEVGLSDEQIAKVKELGKAAAASMKQLRDDAGITAELQKKRTEVQKALRESGKKGKELIAEINKAAGFSEAQAAALAKVNQARTKFQKEVIALLSDEQKAKLPERLQRAAKSNQKGKGKKKKDAA